jgi:hypothetical protein
MRRKECSECGCGKSQYKKDLCLSCWIIYQDNYKEYMKSFVEDSRKFVGPFHKFKLDNLKYLEQCYESRVK